MNKERFHNALALSLGYERIVTDKRITIQVDDSDAPWVSLKFQGDPEVVRFKVSEIDENDISQAEPVIRNVMDAARHAYDEACSYRF